MNTDIIVRETKNADYSTVYNLIKKAFETAEHRDGTEQDFAVDLRNGVNYIPELDLVAVLDGQIVGHIMFTKTYLTKPDGNKCDVLMVAPLSVLLEFRNMSIGSALMKEGFRIAAQMGYGLAFLLGDPNYYRRFGYELCQLYGIGNDAYPAEYLMVKEIIPNALDGITGTINM